MSLAVEAKALTKQFGNIRALDDLSFQIKQGEIYGLIGPNGAGKTTTLRIVSTLILPPSCTINVFNIDATKQPGEIRKIISYLPEEAGAYPNLSGMEYLEFMAKFSQGDMQKTIAEAVEISG